MYELKRIYTGVNEVYVQGKGWIKNNTETKGDVITMYALDYIDIDDSGVVHGTGIEDFSVERFKKLGFGVMELKNKVEKEKKTYKTAFKHEIVKRVFFRYRNKKHGKAFKEYLNSRYGKELAFNEIIATYR